MLKDNKPVVIVKPKKYQSSDITKAELAKKIPNPESINFTEIRKIQQGGLAINCKDDLDLQKLHNEASKLLGEQYIITIPERRNPKIKVTGISDNISNDMLIDCIRKQNEKVKDGDFKVLKFYENKHHKNYGAILETDCDSFNKIINMKKIKIGWDICNVFEDIEVKRCYKCLGYNHKSNVCKNKQACNICSGEHKSDVCKANTTTCINCKTAKEKLKIDIDDKHRANSRDCVIYKRKVERERRRIDSSA